MKLIIQIPAFNEEQTIARTLADLPVKIGGITSIETLVIDDGSGDNTVEAARKAGVKHVIRLLNHRGLATAFIAGIHASLRLGADIIVNTDADNQYVGADIALLVAPIVNGTAEVVIGDRDTKSSPHMSKFKRMLQRLGSGAVGLASGMNVPDVTSGMRAFSREAAYEINVFNPFTYTLETIIQAGNRNLRVESVKVRTNAPIRPSRLYRGIGSYVRKSASTIFRIYALYKPLKTFFFFGSLLLLGGAALGARFLYFLATGGGAGHVQSLILTAVLLIVGFQTLLIGLVADLISVNRRLSEEVLIRMRKLDRPGKQRPAERRDQKPRERLSTADPPAVATTPETNWVWLLDEATIDERVTPVATPSHQNASAPPSRRRRRRRGGMRSAGDHPSNRERIPHQHGGRSDRGNDDTAK